LLSDHSTTTLTCAEIISMENLNKKNDWILLGSGEFGQVYNAIYNQFTKVAIKVKLKFNFFFIVNNDIFKIIITKKQKGD
jgi:predicted unusual protein kinase regulating ubiquinone biosynthesis (AarF/ABC1/UbiB family)